MFRSSYIFRCLIAILVLTGVSKAYAQQYPVQGTLAISSPYPAYLGDYANPNIEKLILNLTLTDLTIANKRVKLKLFIQKQNSLIAQSADNIIGEPTIILDGGVPQRFTSIELANYFKIENLQGINGDAYSQALPEGVYNIGFEVYDYFTGNKLSFGISQLFWLMLNDPPLLNMPRNHENILDANPNNPQIIFQWTPRTTQVTNTEYEFTLSELWDDAGDPYQQFLAAIPKYQTTISNTTLLYGITEPPLLAGRTYAWRVKAKAKAGFEDIGLYRQNGYSEIFVFKYAGQCAAVQGVNIEVKGYDRMYITWQPNPNQNLYKVAYRKYTPSNNWDWHETETFNTFLNLFDLEANTDYEIKVGGVCNDGLVSYSTPQTVKTLQNGQISGINCGQAPVINLANQTLLQHLSVNEVVTAGDFPITITRVEGSSGVYSGEGWVKVPWLADTKIKVKYTGIKVNTDYKLLDGFFETTYDPTGANIGDIDQLIDDLNGIFTGGTNVGHVVTGSDTTKYHVDFDIPDPCTECTFTPDGHGGGTITFGGGHTLTVTELPTTVKDSNGDIYQIDKDGHVIKIGNTGGTGLLAAADKTSVDLAKGRVDFAAATGMVYAFDAWQQAYDNSNAWAKKYESLPSSGGAGGGNGGNYRVSAKAIAPGKPDKVLAKITLIDNTLKADSIKFVNGKGTIYEKKKIDTANYEITMTGGPADDAQEIYALYPQGANKPLNLGKLLVASYAEQIFNVVLVPVKGNRNFDKQKISDSLNRIYNPLNFKVQVTQEDNFNDDTWDADHNGLNVSGSNAISVLTPDMKALNKAYSKSHHIERGTLYLFLLNHAADSSLLGDMPRGKQFGYLFTDNNNHLEYTITHELGHGVFRLKHISDEGFSRTDLPANVMNYPAGNILSKYQWDIMHDPPFVLGVFENDDDGQEAVVNNIEELAKFKNADGSFTFLSGAGKPITLKGNLTQLSFITSEDQWSVTNDFLPLGALYGFELNGKKYTARRTVKPNYFVGYLDTVSNKYYKENLSINKNYLNVLVGIICIKNGKSIFNVFPTNYLDANSFNKNVTDSSQGEGTEQDVFFLNNYLTRDNEAVGLYAQTQELTEQEIFFLDKYSTDGNLCGADALYAFKSAYFIRKNPGLLGCLRDAENDAYAHIHSSISGELQMLNTQNPIDNTNTVVSRTAENEAYKTAYSKLYGTRNFQEYFNKVLEQYKKIIDDHQHSFTDLSNQDISDIISFFDIANARGRMCLLRNVPLGLREEIIKKRKEITFTTSKESLLIDLVETTPDADIPAFLDFLKQNSSEYLWGLYNEINGGNIDRFAAVLSYLVIKKVPGRDAVRVWPAPTIPVPQKIVSPYLRIYKEHTDYTAAGNINYEFYYNSFARKNTDGTITITSIAKKTDLGAGQGTTQTYEFTGNPYDYVNIVFESDFRFTLLGDNRKIRAGDTLIVPVFWVYWMIERQETLENEAFFRLVFDAALVATAVGTAEPGPLLLLDGGVAAVDIGFTLAEDKIATSNNPQLTQISALWETFYTAYNLTRLATGTVGQLRKFSFNKDAIIAKFNELKNIPQQLRKFGDDMYLLLQTVKEFYSVTPQLRSVAYTTMLNTWLRIKIATFSATAEGTELLVSGEKVVAQSGSYAPSIMDVSVKSDGSLLFSNIRWYNEGAVSQMTGKVLKIGNYKYIDKLGKEAEGDLGIIKLNNGQSFVWEIIGSNKIYKNISFEDFVSTVGDFSNGAKHDLALYSYKLWGEEKYLELHKFFVDNNLNNWNGIIWPPFNGAKSIIKTERGSQLIDKVFDRFQVGSSANALGGGFASPVLNSSEGVNDLIFTYDSRALSNKIQEGTYYYKFRIKTNVSSNLEFEYGEAIPWFNLLGNADQIKSNIKFDILLKQGDIEIIETLRFEGGKWLKLK